MERRGLGREEEREGRIWRQRGGGRSDPETEGTREMAGATGSRYKEDRRDAADRLQRGRPCSVRCIRRRAH